MSRANLPRSVLIDAREILTRWWRRGFDTVRRTPGLLLLSFALGVAIWIFVTDARNPVRSGLFPGRIEVHAVNVGRDVAVANALPGVDVRIQAPEDRWNDLTAANFRAVVDLNGLSAREQSVPVQVEARDARAVRVIAVEPPAIVVNLEEIVTRIVPVAPRLVGTLPRGFAASDAVPESRNAEVSGPESLVALVVSARADVNVSGLTVGLSQSVPLVARGASGGEIRGVTIEPPGVRVDVAIEQTTVRRSIPLDVDLVGQPAPGYRVSGVQIRPGVLAVEGSLDVLQGLGGISLGQMLLDGARASLRETLRPDLPPGVRAAEPDGADVIVSVVPVQGSSVVTLAPEAVGAPEGAEVGLGGGAVTAVLDGPLPVLNALGPGDVRAEVDVSGLEADGAVAEVRVVAPPAVRVRDVRPRRLPVTVTLEPPPGEGAEGSGGGGSAEDGE